MFGGVDRGILREVKIDDQLRPVRGGEELLLDEPVSVQRGGEETDGHRNDKPAGAHAEEESGAEQAHETAGFGMAAAMCFHRLWQDRHADYRSEQDRNDPRGKQGNSDHRKQRIAIFAGAALRETYRHKSRYSDERSSQHRKRGRHPRMRRRMLAIDPQFELADHHLYRDHRVVDKEAEGNDQRAERDALQADAGKFHIDENHAEDERDRAGYDHSGSQTEAQEAHRKHDGNRFPQRLCEAADRFLDNDRLVSDEMRLDADRQMRDDLLHLVRHGLAEDQVVATLRHRDGQPDRRFAVEPEHRLRRIGIPFAYRCDIGEAEKFAVRIKIDALQIVDRAERSGDADPVFLDTGLDDAGGCDRVLLL